MSNVNGSRAPQQKPQSVTASSSVYRNTSVTPSSASQARQTPPIQVAATVVVHEHHVIDRVPPYKKSYVPYKYICHYFDPGFHYFGYRVKRLPPRAYRIPHYHRYYYCYEGIYYRYHNHEYYVCRPPYETMLAYEMMKNLELAAVRIRYYNTLNRTYSAISKNNEFIVSQNETIARNNEIIAEQERIIAKNNAIIAQQNSMMSSTPGIAMTTNDGRYLAAKAYEQAEEAGLVQSYAASGIDYYYQDGVFYVIENSQYKVIVPPAGALVEYLPEDYDIINIKGQDYYRVDDTIYKTTTVDGTLYFEVLGQLED